MGEVVVEKDEVVYRQDDGEITAWLNDFEEKMELAHESHPLFKIIFYLLVAIGMLYLLMIFTLF